MKRQFVHIQPTPGDDNPVQAPISGEWSPAQPWEARPHEAASASYAPPKGNGLLSSWKARNPDAPERATPAPSHIAEQDTVIQQSIPNPTTGPIAGGNEQPLAPAQFSPDQPWTGPSSFSPPYAGSSISTQQMPFSQPSWSYAPSNAPIMQPPTPQAFVSPQAHPWPAAPGNSWAGAQENPLATSWQQAPGSFGFQNAPAYQQSAPPLDPPGTKKRQQRQPLPRWSRVLVAMLLVVLVAGGGGAWYYQANFGTHLNNITGQQVVHLAVKNSAGNNQTSSDTTNSANIGNNRINILLLGSDNDAKFNGGAPLAQTDIIVTVDPKTKYVGMLSIPRDMRVNIPDGIAAPNKLDTAFAYGWQYVHVGSTPFSNAVGLSIATIEQNYGIHIDHYAWVGLDGFVKVINTAGGIDLDATHPMVDDDYPNDISNKNAYDYKRLYIPPGPQHMNGIQALEYVRTRHSDLVGDFGRSARQQQVLSQLKTKLDTPGIIDKLNELAADLDGYVKTDMQIPDLINLMNYARSLDPNKVDHAVLSPPYSTLAADNSGDYLPNCALIEPKIAQMFDLGNKATCEAVPAKRAAGSITPPATATNVAIAAPSATSSASLQSLSQASQMGDLSLQEGSSDPLGIRSILDLMFMIVFGSFDATKV